MSPLDLSSGIDTSKLDSMQKKLTQRQEKLFNRPNFNSPSLKYNNKLARNNMRIEISQQKEKQESSLEEMKKGLTFVEHESKDIDQHSSGLETLFTQIGVEETNIKKIGVSGTKPKDPSGSLTERQANLMMLSSSANNTQLQFETSTNQAGSNFQAHQEHGLKTAGLARGATLDSRFAHNRTSLRLSQGPQDTQKTRRSLGVSYDRAAQSSFGHLSQTQVTPFQHQALIIIDQNLTTEDFTAKLRKVKNLDKVDLSQNKITKIPYPELLNLSQTLTHLCLDGNGIGEITEETLRQVPHLTTLKLRANQITRLPDSLYSLAQLKILDVSSNKISTLSAKVSLLRQLRWLNIAENRLEGLPNSLGYLDQLKSLTSEYFEYLPDDQEQGHPHGSPNIQVMVESSGDPDLDWITQHHQRQTIVKGGLDGRFDKIMRFMRLQVALMSNFLELVHEFQPLHSDMYQMLDSEPAMPTEESEQPLIMYEYPCPQNQSSSPQLLAWDGNNPKSASGLLERCSSSATVGLTSAGLQAYSKYLPRQEYNELVTVFRTLQPEPVNNQGTMLHRIIYNNHAHLFRQYSTGIQNVITSTIAQLQSSEATALFNQQAAAKPQQNAQSNKLKQQTLIHNLQVNFDTKVRQAVNGVNERTGMTPLDLVLQSQQQVDFADLFLQIFAKYLDLRFPEIKTEHSPNSEIRHRIPGNQQNYDSGEMGKEPEPRRLRTHPVVATINNGRFQLTGKLIDVALDCYFNRRAEQMRKSQQDKILKEPMDSPSSIQLSSAVMNLAALHGNRPAHLEILGPLNLNIGDGDVGMTLLHHLFSNFDINTDKAANLFRKLKSLHLRRSREHTSSTPALNAIAQYADGMFQATSGTSPRSNRSKLRSESALIGDKSSTGVDAKMTQSPRKLQQISNYTKQPISQSIYNPQKGQAIGLVPRMANTDITPLELNPVTHYFETPFELAIENFQNQAVQFALNWNLNNVHNCKYAAAKSSQQNKDEIARSRSAKRNFHNGPSGGESMALMRRNSRAQSPPTATAKDLRMHQQMEREQYRQNKLKQNLVNDFFDLMSQRNPRKLTPMHRAVICGNFNALKIMLDSPLFFDSQKFSQNLGPQQRRYTLIDLHAMDQFGKTARDYSHKIVFMGKMLFSAYTKQVRRQAGLFAYERELKNGANKKQEAKEKIAEENSVAATIDQRSSKVRNSVLANYDKLISHTTSRRSRRLKKEEILQHTCLNFFFRYQKVKIIASKKQSLLGSQVINPGSGSMSARSHHKQIHESQRRLVKSFAELGTPSMQPSQFKVEKGIGSIFSPQQHQKLSKMSQQQKKASETGTILRQSIPALSKGIKKAKSMACKEAFGMSTQRSRTDSTQQQNSQIFKLAIQPHRKLLKTATKPQNGTNQIQRQSRPGKRDIDFESELPDHKYHVNSLQESEKLPLKNYKVGQKMITRSDTKPKQGQKAMGIDAMLVKNQSIPSNQVYLPDGERDLGHDDEVSMSSITLEGETEAPKRFDERGNKPKTLERSDYSPEQSLQYAQLVSQKRSPTDLKCFEHSPKGLVHESVNVEEKKGLSLISIANDRVKNSQTPASVPKMQFKKPRVEQTSDALKLADLEVPVDHSKQGKETPTELTHDFNDSGSANSFTPLPSIQNNYTLEVKSFTNQWKKPYSQQLSTNIFKDQFDLIMDNQCDQGAAPFTEDEVCANRFNNGNLKNAKSKPMKPHQKVQILFNIVKEAKHPHKLQDAKDVFDFIQYEISTQIQLTRTRVRQVEEPVIAQEQSAASASVSKDQQAQNLNQTDNNSQAQQQKSGLMSSSFNPQMTLTENQEAKKQQNLLQYPPWLTNEEIFFLREEVSYLRCQLDFLSDKIISVPGHSRINRNHINDIFSPSDLHEAQFSISHAETYPMQEEQFTDVSMMGNLTDRKHANQIFSFQSNNRSVVIEPINLGTGTTHPIVTDDVEDEFTHLTEADQELSEDFDENLNTAVKPLNNKSRLVRPSDMLGVSITESDNKGSLVNKHKRKDTDSSSLSRLGNLLSSKTDRTTQKLNISAKRKSMKKLHDQVALKTQISKENLETDEGHTIINQPLVSAELQSFSDRLSQHRQSNSLSKSLMIKPKKYNNPGSQTTRLNVERTATAKNMKQSAREKQQSQQKSLAKYEDNDLSNSNLPKLKYAAFAQIDLASFDFKQQQVKQSHQQNKFQLSNFLRLTKNGPLSEKSRSVIAIPKSRTFGEENYQSANSGSDQTKQAALSSTMRLSSQIQQVATNNSGIKLLEEPLQEDDNTPQVMTIEESFSPQKFQRKMPKIKPFVTDKSGVIPHANTTRNQDGQNSRMAKKQAATAALVQRSDSFRQISQLSYYSSLKSRETASQQSTQVQKKKNIPAIKRTLTNLGTLTSQKLSLKVLQDNQQKSSRIATTQGLGKIPHLAQLSSQSIVLPPQSTKHGPHYTKKTLKEIRNQAASGNNYLHAKIARGTGTNNTANSSLQVTQKPSQTKNYSKSLGGTMILNSQQQPPLSTTNQAAAISSQGNNGTMELSRQQQPQPPLSATNKVIKTHHRLLKDLIEPAVSGSGSGGSRLKNATAGFSKK